MPNRTKSGTRAQSRHAARNKTRDPRRVAALVYDGLCTFEFGICVEFFALPRPELDTSWYSFSAVPVEAGSIHAAGGLEVSCSAKRSELTHAGTILIPGWRGIDAPVPRSLISQLRKAYDEGARIITICSGAYVLAASGLLDGKCATTHWRYAADFRTRFPAVDLQPDRLYVEEDRLCTSAGSAAGIDTLLHLVRSDYGAETANTVARRLVVPTHRQGEQQQFVTAPVPTRYEADRLAPLLDYLRRTVQEPHSVESVAAYAGMTPRTLQRRFTAMTGTSVRRWLTAERLRVAREHLEKTDAPLLSIAAQVGFGSVESLHYHFRQRLKVSPGQYRARFRHASQDVHERQTA
ncbi:MAG: transcriptional regulator FtrA [Pseudomonadota bacterium]